MKAGLIAVVMLMLAGQLSGCGQKGPLYQEAPAEPSAEQAAASGTDPDRPPKK